MSLTKYALSCAFALAALGTAQAQDNYPSKPITFVSQFAAGGGQFKIFQIISEELQAKHGITTVIENRPGGTGAVAKQFVANAPADGYMLMIGSAGPMVVNPQFDPPAKGLDTFEDFTPIALLVTSPYVINVHPSLPVNTVEELTAYAKANPGVLNYCSTGPGSMQQLATELYKSMTGTDIVHVPFAGGGESVAGVLSNVVQVCISDIGNVTGHLKSGLLRGLSTTGATRSVVLPDMPTTSEAGVPGYQAYTWHGLFAPAGTPPEVVAKLNGLILEVLADPGVQEKLAAMGLEAGTQSPDEFAAFLRTEFDKWKTVIAEANIKIE